MTDARVKWKALESNPDSLTKFSASIGLPSDWIFTDILGTDEELLQFVPQPCLAVILLFPIPVKSKWLAAAPLVPSDSLPAPFYLRQPSELGNACGTIACIHAMANLKELLGVPADAKLRSFLKSVEGLSPRSIGLKLNETETINSAHNDTATDASTNQTEVQINGVAYHFVAFIEHAGHLVELDGAKAQGPIDYGVIEPDSSVLKKSASIIRKHYMDQCPGELGFSMMALVKNS